MSRNSTLKDKSGLGKALKNRVQKKRFIGSGDKAPIFFQQTEQNEAELKKQKMKSVIDQNSLTQFLQIAEMSQQNFQANRDIKFRQVREQVKNKKIIISNKKSHYYVQQTASQQILFKMQLPRRPHWKNIKTKEQFERAQNQAYLNWRRKLAQVEQKNPEAQITPYQKNIQVWKQLWRVAERSDVLVQIVDGRDPIFFRSEDLVQYSKELNPDKLSLLLINKSDLVSIQIRQRWNKYFLDHKIDHIFFTAKPQTIQPQMDSDSNFTKQESSVDQQIAVFDKYVNQTKILSITELNQLFHGYTKVIKKQAIQIGLVGYPNVGKSSVINALLGKKKVGVASMPGKTKHFQTLALSDLVTLCDCPGLVFPRVSSTFAQMILNGLYPIDTMKKHHQAFEIMALRIPQKRISQLYALHWKQDEPYDADTILNKYSQLKGFYGGNGTPNQSVAARHIMKDYVNGQLIYAKNPPGYQVERKLSTVEEEAADPNVEIIAKPQHQINMKKIQHKIQKDLDNQFFDKIEPQIKLLDEDIVSLLNQEDFLDIVEGKKIGGLKITKQMRKTVKHCLKRGDDCEKIKKIFLAGIKQNHRVLIKG